MKNKITKLFNLSLLFFTLLADLQSINAAELLVRNPYDIENHMESKHFVVYWGSGLNESNIQPLLDYLEVNWAFIIEEKQFLPPITTKNYKENIYISGTGQPLLDDEEGAIQGLDKEGHEHIIMHKDTLFDARRLRVTVVHEFFHSIQTRYKIPQLSHRLWIGEATATWSAFMTLPNDTEHLAINALAQYAFYPQYSLDAVLENQSEEYYLLSGHNYGAFIFFSFLTEYFNDPNLVHKLFNFVSSKISQRDDKFAINVLSDFIEETYSEELRPLFHQFVAKNSIWDYPDQQAYLTAISIQAQSHLNEHTAKTINRLSNTWETVDSKYLPHRWGANYIKYTPENKDTIDIGFEGNALGQYDSPAQWQASIVKVTDEDVEYIQLPLSDNKVNAFTIDTKGAKEIWLAVDVVSTNNNNNEVYAYRYLFSEEGQGEVSPSSAVEYQKTVITPPVEEAKNTSSGGNITLFCFIFIFFIMPFRK